MSSYEENCEHPAPWIDYFDCGCRFCCACTQFIEGCAAPNGPDCKAQEVWFEKQAEKDGYEEGLDTEGV